MSRVVAIIKDEVSEETFREHLGKVVGFSVEQMSGKLVAIQAPDNSVEFLNGTGMFKLVIAEVLYPERKKK